MYKEISSLMLRRFEINIKEETTWQDVKFKIKDKTGIYCMFQLLTPCEAGYNKCELENGETILCEWHTEEKRHPLHWAAGAGNIDAIRFWIISGIDIRDIYQQTPLMIAQKESKKQSVKELLSLGANDECIDKTHCMME